MRAILIIGDGMADRPVKELGYKTPLEAAEPKHMNSVASNGISGLLDPIAPDVAGAGMHVMPLILNLLGKPKRIGG